MKTFLGGTLVGLLIGCLATQLIVRILNPPTPGTLANAFGTFPAQPRAEWLPDGRKMRLLEDFVYIDPRKTAWVAPAGSVVDGASIPSPLA